MFLRSQGSNIGVWLERGRQLFGEILAIGKRGVPRGRVPNESQQKTSTTNVKFQYAGVTQKGFNNDSILARFAKTYCTQATALRRSATMRMMGLVSRQNVVGFAFVGLAIANESRQKKDGLNLMPLDICCQVVKSTFQKSFINNPTDLPSDIASYDLYPQLLGKGCNASIYAAKVKDVEQTFTSRSSSLSDLDDFDVVPMETATASDISSEDDFVVLGLDEEGKEQGSQSQATKPEEGFDLAIKMMFNYDVMSNVLDISCAFEREYLPLQQVPDALCETSMLQWENGNHVKKKRKKQSAAHPNVVAMYHAFAAPVEVHDLTEARELFPAALPSRIHTDGMGRNMTMFLVMKRYDMTLTEYTRSVGCQSQRVAMVIVAQLLEGVSHLVASGIAHRDLKGNNILVNLDPDGGSPHVVLADFGCSLADSDVGLVLPYPSSYTCIGGNTALMAPEVKLAEPGPDAFINYAKSDAWAIGAITYEVLGLRNPFYRDGTQSGLNSASYQECDLPSLPVNTHPTLIAVVKLLLRKDPAKRLTPQIAADMLHLSLWQPDWWKNACWESGHLLPTQHHISSWLLHVSMATRDSHPKEVGGDWLWQNATEHRLCESWLSRVEKNELTCAVCGLYGIWPMEDQL